MAGLLSGLLGIAALPPLSFLPAGLIWLVPWLSVIDGSTPRRVLDAILAIGLPAGFTLAPAVIAEPQLTLLATAATTMPFVLTAILIADRQGHSPARRRIAGVIILCGLLGGLRILGLPLSLSLFLPASFPHLPMIGIGGILAADLAIGLLQSVLVIAVMHQRTRSAPPPAIARILLALLTLMPLVLLQPRTPIVDDADRQQIAIIQTNLTPQARRQAIADGVLETLNASHRQLAMTAAQLDADWIIWPEAATPGFLGTDWRSIDPSGSHLRHGYTYHRPGHVDSEVRILNNNGRGDSGSPRWAKQYPLPFAERNRIQAHQRQTSVSDIKPLEVLICSDATHPAAVDRAAAREPRVILNPASLAYLGSVPLPGLHQRSVHLQAARVGIAMIVVANAGPSAVLYPDGRSRVLAEAYTTGVARIALPSRYTTSHQSAGIPYGLIAIGFIALSGRQRRGMPIVDRQSGLPAWAIAGLAAVSIGITTGLQHRTLEALSAAVPSIRTPMTTAAIQSPRSSDRGSVALLARVFGIAADWRQVPASTGTAMTWLCRRTGLVPMGPTTAPIQPPAFGLQRSATGLRAVHWRADDPPIAFDATTGEFLPIDANNPTIHWLMTTRTEQDCRSVIALE